MSQFGRVVLATANPHKTTELAAVLERVLSGWSVEPRPDGLPDVIEDADTFVGNARLKAQALVRATGSLALADDSGLVVDALGGAPGVRSSRFAGEKASDADNVNRLLADLAAAGATNPEERSARFTCVILLLHPDGTEVTVQGQVEGVIADQPSGGGGFGYDPVFVPAEGDGRTFAQMSADEKNSISHRGRALERLAEVLTN